ncbi:MAG: sugar phosphate nucleotidyltransferase, partial [Candidatus Thorarchaeota archaeon]
MVDIEKFLVNSEMSIKDVIALIDKGAKGIALVVDESRHLIGTITDGDIRRAILERVDLQKKAHELLIQKASTPYPEPITAPVGASDDELLALMQKHSIKQIPLLKEGHVVDLALLTDFLPETKLPLNAVVMAGGYGKRLHPFTENLPKPMLPVGDQPMLELIIEQLKKAGIQRVNITTHYLPEK